MKDNPGNALSGGEEEDSGNAEKDPSHSLTAIVKDNLLDADFSEHQLKAMEIAANALCRAGTFESRPMRIILSGLPDLIRAYRALSRTPSAIAADDLSTPSDVDILLFRLAAQDCEHLAAGMMDCSDELPFADWCVVCQARGLLQKYSRATTQREGGFGAQNVERLSPAPSPDSDLVHPVRDEKVAEIQGRHKRNYLGAEVDYLLSSLVGERERCAKLLEDKIAEYESDFNQPPCAANGFSEMTIDTPAGYATYHAFKTLLPKLVSAIRDDEVDEDKKLEDKNSV